VSAFYSNPAQDDGRYRFVTDCVSSTYADVSALVDSEERIKLRTFQRKLAPGEWARINVTLGYDRSMPLSRDPHVAYFKGVYRGTPAVFLVWSGIEQIFTLDGEQGPSADPGFQNLDLRARGTGRFTLNPEGPLVTRQMNLDLQRARRDVEFVLSLVDLIGWLRNQFPDQVRGPVASMTKAQWSVFDEAVRGQPKSMEAQARFYERWKRKVRDRRLAWDGPPAIPDMHPLTSFSLSVPAVEAADVAAIERRDRLEAATGRRPARRRLYEYGAGGIASELGTTGETVRGWARAGLPFRRKGKRGTKTGAYLFDLDEVVGWVRKHGGPKSRWIVAKATVTPQELGEVIASSGSMEEAAAKLGLSEYQFRQLRKLRRVHAPSHGRAPVEELVSSSDLLEAARVPGISRDELAQELGIYRHELTRLISAHGLKDHPVFRSLWRAKATRDEVLAAIEKHAGMRDAMAADLGMSRQTLRRTILEYDLEDHPLLQAGRMPARAPSARAPRGDARARGHSQLVSREETAHVPFWLAALREVRTRHPERGGNRRTAEDIGISPVSVTNLLQGKRVPGYGVMLKILQAAGWPEPDWRQGVRELVNKHSEPYQIARGTMSAYAGEMAGAEIGVAPITIGQYLAGNRGPSMVTMQRILEATGRPYFIQAVSGTAHLPTVSSDPFGQAAAALIEIHGGSRAAMLRATGLLDDTVLRWLRGERQMLPKLGPTTKLRKALRKHKLQVPAEVEARYRELRKRKRARA
jgi:transcriptional regulator with XRE-family HTH domain/AraC-like DNA-binding protein